MTYKQSAWSLTDLFPGLDSPELEGAFKTLDAHLAGFEKLRPQLTPNMPVSSFLEILQEIDEATRMTSKLGSFAYLSFAADTQDQRIQTLLGRVQQFMADMENRSLFFKLWWKDLDEANASRLMAASGDVRYYLEMLRKFKPHTLNEGEEKIVNLKNVTGSAALTNLYDSLTNRYVFKVKVDGKIKKLSRDELMVLVRQPDPDLRLRAYRELYHVYAQDGAILGQIYQAMLRDWHNENVTLRHFPNPIAARNLGNDIPDEAVEALLKVAKKNTGIFQRFFRLKAHLLGMQKLRRCDIYAPVVESDKTYPFDQAADIVLESFSSFHPDFGEQARRVLAENHLDSEIRKGKQGGGFCNSVVPEMTPWVKINYTGRPNEVGVMAHELGHAIHSMQAAKHSVLTFQACLPLAETASTFGEMMLVDRLLASETDAAVRRDLLFHQVDNSYATIMRQAYFALFEKRAHEMVQNNASVEDICAAYLDNLREQFGDAVEVSEEFKWEWISIPHFYWVPFYVYAYAFGELLVHSLYQQYKAEGESFKPRYLRILSAGGSEAPAKVLADAGIDIQSEVFWQGGFDVLARLVDELEGMK